MYSQLLKLFPRTEFQALVKRTHAERHARGFTCWGQFIAMLFCQLGRAHSLSEITQGLAASEGKLKHLGLSEASGEIDPGLCQPAPSLGALSDCLFLVAAALSGASR